MFDSVTRNEPLRSVARNDDSTDEFTDDSAAGRHRQKVSNPARNFQKCPGHFGALKSTGAGGRSRLHQPASLRLRFCVFFGRIPFRYHCSGFRVMMRSTGSILFATRFLWKKYLKHVVEL